MNRIVLIGNGFDLAHDLETRYEHFIYWYWKNRVLSLCQEPSVVSEDRLCKLRTKLNSWSSFVYQYQRKLQNASGKEIYSFLKNNSYFEIKFTPFFERIHYSIETKKWVDIENEYYELLKQYALENKNLAEVEKLNDQLLFLQDKLVEYLKSFTISDGLLNESIRRKIYAPFEINDISIEGQQALKEHVEYWLNQKINIFNSKFRQYDNTGYTYANVSRYRSSYGRLMLNTGEVTKELLLPNHIMLLNFNYTHTAYLYCKEGSIFSVNQIHGDLGKESSIIFGYGDELDNDYKKLRNQNENKCLTNIKSIKYLESDNYRKMLAFIESQPFQVCIMGHSCGNSDRTLLNTLFEHKNCISIKPYYYINEEGEDNYLELVQNISRNFTDMKLMRDRVVNKEYCEPFSDDSKKKTD